MKIVIAPNALKGSLSAHDAANAMEQGARRAHRNLSLVLHPVADGGDGFAHVLSTALKLNKINISVSGPLGTPLSAPLYFNADRSLAVIEMATIAGLSLLSEQDRQPLLTTSFGVGEAIKIALDSGAKRIIIGIGGSATNDAGIGMASALGLTFLNRDRESVKPIGRSLQQIVDIDSGNIDPRLKQVKIEVACDVDNPFCGDQGAAMIFAAQKGASPEQVLQLENGMRQFAQVVNETLNIDMSTLAGAGAAGGIGGGLWAFCGATLAPGIDIVLDSINFNQALENTSLVLTAEGHFDSQTHFGKAPAGVAKQARRHNVPCIVLAGRIELKSVNLDQSDFSAAFSLCPGPLSSENAMQHASEYLADVTEQVVRSFIAAKDLAATMKQE